jgi:hypothetical protein
MYSDIERGLYNVIKVGISQLMLSVDVPAGCHVCSLSVWSFFVSKATRISSLGTVVATPYTPIAASDHHHTCRTAPLPRLSINSVTCLACVFAPDVILDVTPIALCRTLFDNNCIDPCAVATIRRPKDCTSPTAFDCIEFTREETHPDAEWTNFDPNSLLESVALPASFFADSAAVWVACEDILAILSAAFCVACTDRFESDLVADSVAFDTVSLVDELNLPITFRIDRPMKDAALEAFSDITDVALSEAGRNADSLLSDGQLLLGAFSRRNVLDWKYCR